MPRSPLALRPFWMIALAYGLAPLIGIFIVAAVHESPRLLGAGNTVLQTFEFVWRETIIAAAMCVPVELVVVTPLLLAFRRYRWPWLNVWSGMAIGSAVSILIAEGIYPVVCLLDDMPVLPMDTLRVGLAAGALGAIGALVFRLLAVRREPAIALGGEAM